MTAPPQGAGGLEREGLALQAAWTENRKKGFQPLPVDVGALLVQEAAGKAYDEPLLTVPSHPARGLDLDLKAAGIRKRAARGKIDFHALRNTFITMTIEAGASVKEAQTLARHASPDLTFNVYARAREERLSAVAEALAGPVLNGNGVGLSSSNHS